ncbi:hypothetical protein GJV11_10780 [Enterobacteriaceae bacterium RIT693]|nr:hypothetical protein [Enterobacteriaceae bacterium RIT693]
MESVAALIVKYDTIINSVFWLLILLFIFSYISLRAGSGYSIVNRLWYFFLGNPSFTDKKLNAFWTDRNDIEHFNMLFNVKSNDKIEIKKFITWATINKIDITKVSRAKGWFNISTLELLVPRKKTTFFIFICSFFFIYLSLVALTIAIKPAALIRVDNNEPWIWVGKNQITNYFPNISLKKLQWENWSLSTEDCNNNKFDRNNFSTRSRLKIKTIDMLCNSYSSVEDQKSILAVIKKQNAFYFISAIPFIYGIYFFILCLRRVLALELSFEIRRKTTSVKMNKK